MQQHLIHNARFDLRLQNAQNASEKQHQAAEIFHKDLLKVMEEVFDAHVPEDRNWRFDTLQIDLGLLDLENRDEWLVVLRERLTTTLLDFKNKETENCAPLLAESKVDFVDKNLIANDLDSLIYFFKTGRLPWWTLTVEPFDVSEKLILLAKQEPEKLQTALKVIYTEGGVLERLMQQCSEKSLHFLVENLSISRQKMSDLSDLIFESLGFFIKNKGKNTISVSDISNDTVFILHKLKQRFFIEAVLFSNKEDGQLLYLVKKMLEFIDNKNDFDLFFRFLKEFYFVKIGKIVHLGWVLDLNKNRKNSDTQQEGFKDLIETQLKENPAIELPVLIKKQTDEDAEMLVLNKADNDAETGLLEDVEKDSFFIQNAGLILIAPLLRPMFQSLGFIEKKAFVSKDVQERAVLLSQYLVTGVTELPEYQLILNKILCAYPLEDTLAARFEPTEQEQAACAELYQTISQNWVAMRRTTEGVFRSSFLQRLGKLQKRASDEAWQLTVERQSIDVLFDTVPPKWSFGFVKFPWMAAPIWTEW